MPDGNSTLFDPQVADAALGGLLALPKTLPSKLFYDEAGCALFDRITELPEYYVTRTELALLERVAPEFARRAPAEATLVEYGAGSETKAAIVLRALDRPAAYVPVDVAGDALHAAAMRLRDAFPGLAVWPIEADFLRPLELPADVDGRRIGFFPGSTIGNLEPYVAAPFLRSARATLGDGALFLVGADLRKDPAILLPAYDDAQGVTAAFNMNLLTRLNREAGASFDPAQFAHRAVWNEAEGRIEMHLVSLAEQVVAVAGQPIAFAHGETIHTENSYKHTASGFTALAGSAGWRLLQLWTDPDELFALYLLQAEAA